MEKLKETSVDGVQRAAVVSQVYQTNDYNLFTFLTSNRELSEKNRKKLEKSCERKQILSPILVRKTRNPEKSEPYEIIDGQHRFKVWESLGLPIYYIVADYDNEDVSLLNQIDGHWVLKDFLRNQVKNPNASNHDSYVKFNDLLERFANVVDDDSVKGLTFTEILYIVTGYGSTTTNDFKNGRLNISDDDYDKAAKYCTILDKFCKKDVAPIDINFRKYLRALLDLVKCDGWEENDMTKHLLEKLVDRKYLLNHKNYNGSNADNNYKHLIKDVISFGAKKGSLYLRSIDVGPGKFDWQVVKLN